MESYVWCHFHGCVTALTRDCLVLRLTTIIPLSDHTEVSEIIFGSNFQYKMFYCLYFLLSLFCVLVTAAAKTE